MTMNAEHIERHKALHAALDELVGDFLAHECAYPNTRGPSNITVMELIEWSQRQTLNPVENESNGTNHTNR